MFLVYLFWCIHEIICLVLLILYVYTLKEINTIKNEPFRLPVVDELWLQPAWANNNKDVSILQVAAAGFQQLCGNTTCVH